MRIATTLALFVSWCLSSVAVLGQADDRSLAGSVEAVVDGKRTVLTAMSSRYDVDIDGDIVNVKLTQRFDNPFNKPVNAQYLFPMNKGAAVHTMTMHVGDEIVSAEIQEIRQAEQTFKVAKKAGKSATILNQHRPNMFTQRIANLMPGVPIEVDIHYTHVVPKVDGAYELVVPLVVGPRFQPAGAGRAPDDGSLDASDPAGAARTGSWQLEQLPAYAPTRGVHVPEALPDSIEEERVSLAINLDTPLPLVEMSSATHVLTTRHVSSTQAEIAFAKGQVIDNKDFVLRYRFDGSSVDGGVLAHWEEHEGGYFSLLLEPPAEVPPGKELKREMVFLLDCSGSMDGLPMEASKRFMVKALERLRPSDTFRIIRFSDTATEFSAHPLSATPTNIERGVHYVRSLYGSGGTHMMSGVEQALSGPPPGHGVRNVVFLTDGYIGNELSVLRLVASKLGSSRLVAFGVGTGVNRYLLDELGRVGQGFTRYFDPTQSEADMHDVVDGLVARLQTPVLTDIQIDWGDLAVENVLPTAIPDLYHGDSVRIVGRFREAVDGKVTVRGVTRESRAVVEMPLRLDREVLRPAIRRIWARGAVAEKMHTLITPHELRADGVTDQQLQAGITQLGLNYALTTRWTAFVAVSERVYNPRPEDSVDGAVPLPKVAGVTNKAYGQPTVTGYGTPEPGVWLSLLVVGLVLGLRQWGRRQVAVARYNDGVRSR